MRVPVPTNRLVAFTLLGALLTALVAGGLAFPGLGLVTDSSGLAPGDSGGTQQVAGDAPEPNQNFTPAVQSGYEDEEYEDEHDEEDNYHEEEDDHDEEYEDEADDDAEHGDDVRDDDAEHDDEDDEAEH
ncbi:hypothetical protein [Halobellus ordinarius]|uniref:hypothetical protein n=1 Tax=Halobellus ordinarius TaxID=3075120 RepID=UPI0028809A69|nr:hypothetical protein [Halobellus sp. ZY16]